MIPHLRDLTKEKHDIFMGIVASAYMAKGMPPFGSILKPDEVNAIHAYVKKRSHDLVSELKAAGKR